MRLLQWTVLFATVLFTSQAFAVKDFSFKDINGKQHKISDYKGKWTIVNYWGVRCAPCRAEVPELNNIVRKYRSKATVIGIELMSSSNSDIRRFMSNNGMRFTVAGTQSSVINPLGTIRKLPTTFILSPDGKLVKTHAGILTERAVRGYLNKKTTKNDHAKKPKSQQVAKNSPAAAPQATLQAKALVATPTPSVKKAKNNNHDMLMNIDPNDFF